MIIAKFGHRNSHLSQPLAAICCECVQLLVQFESTPRCRSNKHLTKMHAPFIKSFRNPWLQGHIIQCRSSIVSRSPNFKRSPRVVQKPGSKLGLNLVASLSVKLVVRFEAHSNSQYSFLHISSMHVCSTISGLWGFAYMSPHP